MGEGPRRDHGPTTLRVVLFGRQRRAGEEAPGQRAEDGHLVADRWVCTVTDFWSGPDPECAKKISLFRTGVRRASPGTGRWDHGRPRGDSSYQGSGGAAEKTADRVL